MRSEASRAEAAGEASEKLLPVCAGRCEDHSTRDAPNFVLQREIRRGEVVAGGHGLQGVIEGETCELAVVLRGVLCTGDVQRYCWIGV